MVPEEDTPLLKGDRAKGSGTRSCGAYANQVVVAGTGFLADAYDLFVIDLVIAILHRLHPNGVGAAEKSLIASATLSGAVVGQLCFGLLGDWLGRKWTFLATCFLIVFGALGSACVVWTTGSFSLVYQLALCRFLLGIGVGGEYPLAAAIAAESSDKSSRGRLTSAVFSMQGWGMLLSCAFTLLFLSGGVPLEAIWRLLLALGAVPSALVIYLRAKMDESELFKRAQELADPSLDKAGSAPSFSAHLSRAWRTVLRYWRPMVGTTMTWLLLDVTFYGTGSFKSRISAFLVDSGAETHEEEIFHEAMVSMLLVGLAIPGYLLSIAFIDSIGRYNLQLGGFLAMAANFFAVAYLYRTFTGDLRWILVVFFGLTFLFSNFGPNTTTFVVPVEIYPTLVRATCHGISAAAGKIGAVIGTAAFSPMEEAFGIQAVLACCGVVCLAGAGFTAAFTSDEVLDLQELDEGAHALG